MTDGERTVTVELPRRPDASRRARSAVREFAPGLAPAARERAQLVVSELVSNALRHGRGRLTLSLILEPDGRLSGHVIDDGHGFEAPSQRPADDETGGRGLWIVDGLAQSWGIRRGTTRVWFEMPA